MRLFLTSLCLLIAAAMPGAAQTVTVKSGDHAGFSRLVFYLPERMSYALGGNGQRREVTFGVEGLRFATSEVFTRMTRRRLAGIRQSGDQSALRLDLNCACDLRAEWLGRAMLVVDILDPEPDLSERPAAAGAARKSSRPGGRAAQTGAVAYDYRLDARPAAVPRTARELVTAGFSPRPSLADPAAAPSESDMAAPPRPSIDIRAMRRGIAQQLTRAADQGLIALARQEEPVLPDDPVAPSPLVAPAPHPALAGPVPETDPRDEDQMTLRNAVDEKRRDAAPPIDATMEGLGCPDPAYFDIASWGGGREAGETAPEEIDMAAHIGPLRKGLSGEFDRIDIETAKALALAYLYYGFGTEARDALRLSEAQGLAARIAYEMSFLLDQEWPGEEMYVAGFLECNSPAGFWAALAHDPIPRDAGIDPEALMRTLSTLPPHLRDYLGPLLARRLITAGQSELATRILRRLQRAPGADSDVERLARIEAAPPDAPASGQEDAELARVTEANGEEAAVALLRRIDRRLAAGQGVPEEMADLAGSYALELRDREIGRDLMRAYVEAIAASGDFDRAFAELARLSPDLDTGALRHARDMVLELATRNASDVAFIRHVTGFPEEARQGLDPRVTNAVADRLVTLGFASLASGYITGAPTAAENRARRLLRARIALAEDRPRVAEVELLGLHGPDVNLLRARAREAVGQFDAAYMLYASGGQEGDALRMAVASENWPRVAEMPDADMAKVAAELLLPDPEVPPEAPIAAGRALLSESEAARARIGALLAARPSP